MCALATLFTAEHVAMEATDSQTPRRRLQTLARWCVTGRLAGAELELHEWVRKTPNAPPAARFLLAALLGRRGADREAIAVLGPVHRGEGREASIGELQLAVTLLITARLHDAATRAARELHSRFGHEAGVRAWLLNLRVLSPRELPDVPAGAARELAAEILARPGVVTTLTYAMKQDPQPPHLRLLRAALPAVAADLSTLGDPESLLTVYTALAELAVLAGDEDEARRWAHRGLSLNPYAASLALVLAEVRDEPSQAERATQVLERVSQAHPSYPDVAAALIRRTRADGHLDEARLKLAQWRDREPENPIAAQLVRELAA